MPGAQVGLRHAMDASARPINSNSGLCGLLDPIRLVLGGDWDALDSLLPTADNQFCALAGVRDFAYSSPQWCLTSSGWEAMVRPIV